MKKGKEKKRGGGKKTMETGRIEPSSCISISNLLLKSPMPYPSPTVTLQLHCEQFWTFIVYANARAQCDVQHTQAELYIDDTTTDHLTPPAHARHRVMSGNLDL